ncbi:21788_t:CDS:2, partial [Gigaspora rosea]
SFDSSESPSRKIIGGNSPGALIKGDTSLCLVVQVEETLFTISLICFSEFITACKMLEVNRLPQE